MTPLTTLSETSSSPRHAAALDAGQADGEYYEHWGDLAPQQRDLLDRGFTHADTCVWSFLGYGHTGGTQAALDIPCLFRDAGFIASEGRAWYEISLNPDQARHYKQHGWTAHDVRQLRRELHQAGEHGPRPSASNDAWDACRASSPESDWITSDIAACYVHLYIQAGHTPTTARVLEDRRRAGDNTIEPALATLAALRRTQP